MQYRLVIFTDDKVTIMAAGVVIDSVTRHLSQNIASYIVTSKYEPSYYDGTEIVVIIGVSWDSIYEIRTKTIRKFKCVYGLCLSDLPSPLGELSNFKVYSGNSALMDLVIGIGETVGTEVNLNGRINKPSSIDH